MVFWILTIPSIGIFVDQIMMMFQEEPVVEKPKPTVVKQPIKDTTAEKENGQPPKKIT